MGLLRKLVVCAAMVAISGTAARAADMPDNSWFPSRERSLRSEELYSGWYLRGDVGYRFQRIGSASDFFNEYTSNTIKNAFMGSVGAGYKLQWFRADLTGDYGWRSLYNGTPAGGTPSVSAKIDTFTVMLNGYIDLGTWGGFTPYVGAGIGGANISVRDYETMPPTTIIPTAATRWNVAWSAMAGVSYDIMYNLKVDVGYRHVNMGDAIGGPTLNQLTVKKLTGDEIRVGIRYLID